MSPTVCIASLFILLVAPSALARDIAPVDPADGQVELSIEGVTSGDEVSIIVETYTPGGALLSSSEIVLGGPDGRVAVVLGTDGCIEEDGACDGERGWSTEEIAIIVETYLPTDADRSVIPSGFVVDATEIISPYFIIDPEGPYDASVHAEGRVLPTDLALSVTMMPDEDWISISPIPTPTP